MRWCRDRSPRVQVRRSRVLVATAPSPSASRPARPVRSGSSTSTTQPCGAGASPRARRSPPRFTSTPVTPGTPAARRLGRHLVGRRALPDAAEIDRHAEREPYRPHEIVELDVTTPRCGPGSGRPVVATGAGDRVEVAVVAGGLERGEHGGVVPTTGVVPGIDRACEQRERALRHHDGRARRVVELAQLARRTEPRPARLQHLQRVGGERTQSSPSRRRRRRPPAPPRRCPWPGSERATRVLHRSRAQQYETP